MYSLSWRRCVIRTRHATVAVGNTDTDFDNEWSDIANSLADDDHSDVQSCTTTGQYEEFACVRHPLVAIQPKLSQITGYCSIRMVHTSNTIRGQIYVPAANWICEFFTPNWNMSDHGAD